MCRITSFHCIRSTYLHKDGETALMAAASRSVDIAELLIQHDANKDQCDTVTREGQVRVQADLPHVFDSTDCAPRKV